MSSESAWGARAESPRRPPPVASPLRVAPYSVERPARNMALDAALLACATTATLRLYGWGPHAVSLGHFQRDADLSPYRAAGLPVVRRMTGGGAIVHAHEVTYSLLLPEDHPLLRGLDVKSSYAAIHSPIRAALRTFGVETEIRPEPVGAHADRSFLCFARATELDLVAAGRKIVGSAQRRKPGRVLQHGSILLRNHPLQPGTSCASEIAGREIDAATMAEALRAAFADAFGPAVEGAITPEESAAADAVEASYAVV